MTFQATLSHKAIATGNSTTAKTWTYSPTYPSLIVAARGYVNDVSGIFPTSLTWGAQSISRIQVATGYVGSGTNVELALYWADSSDIAAMSGGSGTITYNSTLAIAYEVPLGVIEIEDASDTIVDSGFVDGEYVTRDITLTTAAGNLCFMICAERGDQGGLTTAAGMTDWDGLDSSSNGLSEANVKIDYIVASGASTVVAIDGDADEISCSIGVAIADGGGGGGSSNVGPQIIMIF